MSVAAEAVVPEWRIGDRILRARKHAGMEQAELGEALGVSRALVSMWERDLSEPRVSQARKIAEVTGVSETWLLSTSMYDSTPLRLIYGELPEQLRLLNNAR